MGLRKGSPSHAVRLTPAYLAQGAQRRTCRTTHVASTDKPRPGKHAGSTREARGGCRRNKAHLSCPLSSLLQPEPSHCGFSSPSPPAALANGRALPRSLGWLPPAARRRCRGRAGATPGGPNGGMVLPPPEGARQGLLEGSQRVKRSVRLQPSTQNEAVLPAVATPLVLGTPVGSPDHVVGSLAQIQVPTGIDAPTSQHSVHDQWPLITRRAPSCDSAHPTTSCR